jgi:phytoene dehydrogenase-like protein
MVQTTADAIVVGAGHNGLVSALILARAGLKVEVYEERAVVGGAVRTEKPFAKAPDLATSTGAYLLGVMQPELLQRLGLNLPLKRRDPHYFLPTTNKGYLLFGSDHDAMKQQFLSFFSAQDWNAYQALQAELEQIRNDIAPTWLQEPLSIEETAAKYVRPALRDVFIQLCRGSVGDYLNRFDFKSDLVKAMYGVTDGFSGLFGTWSTPGTGMNFLVHNMCRLPGSDGTWMIVEGGMGTITKRLAEEAVRAGAVIHLNQKVDELIVENGHCAGIVVGGAQKRAAVTLVNADPFRTMNLAKRERLPKDFVERIDGMKRDGSTFKVNMALKGLPKFTCLPEDKGQYGPTIHLLPDEKDVMRSLEEGFADVKAGRLPAFPTIEWYIHTTVDPTLKDKHGHHNSALFVQWVPRKIAGSSWEAEEAKYVQHLLSICDRFAPGTSDLVVDTFPLHPDKIEQYFGITHGHIHHIDNAYGFTDRVPYAWPLQGLYSCSAGTHPAGSVVGSAGHNAAVRALKDMGKTPVFST